MITILKKTLGVNNRISPIRMESDHTSGVTFLSKGSNMIVTEDGSLDFPFGYSSISSGEFHSGYCNKGEAYVGNGNAVYQLLPDNSLVGVRDGLSGGPFSFIQYGSKILYSDCRANNGILFNGISSDWPTSEYLVPTNRHFNEAPIGDCLAVLDGIVYMAIASDPNVMVWSEPKQVGLFNLTENFRTFEYPITMIAAVESGLFVSTTQSTFFVNKNGMIRGKKDFAPAVKGTLAHEEFPARIFNPQFRDGMCRLWRGASGGFIGLPDGTIQNFTEDNILIPSGCSNYGSSVVIKEEYFYHSAK